MQCTEEGHIYSLEGNQELRFLKKEKVEGQAELKTVYTGTTNEEVLEVLLDRTKNLNSKFPCIENQNAITHMEQALHWFNLRTSKRKTQGVEGTNETHKS